MKKTFLIIFCIFLLTQTEVFSEEKTVSAQYSTSSEAPVFYTAAQQARDVTVFCEKNKFGLKDKNGNIVVPAKYQKLIMTGRSGWIAEKGNKYGIMDSKGNYLVKPKYRYADRILGRYVKLGNNNDYGIYNEFGEAILPPEYSSIELLYGKMFLTYKNYRYGVSDFKGNILIPNICDDIYMPAKDKMRIKYLGDWYEIADVSADKLSAPDFYKDKDTELNIKDIVAETGAVSGYSVLTVSDYLIKVLSSVSPAHEDTIDDLVLSHGVDTVGILKTFSWIPKYPVTFAKKYYSRFRNPFNGPLSDTRNKLKNKRGS